MSRTKNASKNILIGTVEKTVGVLVPFFTRTVLLHVMGIEYAGLSNLFTSVLSILSLTELGFGSALVFSMYKPIAEEDAAKICALLRFYRNCYRLVGLIILAAGLCIMPFLDHLIAGEIPEGVSVTALFVAYLFNTVIGYFLFAYRSSLFTASQRVGVISGINAAIHLLTGMLQCALLIIFRNYYVFVFVLPATTCIGNLITGWLSFKQYPQYRCEGKLEQKEIRAVGKKALGLFFQRIGGVILNPADALVISAFLGLRTLGIYNGYHCVITAMFGFLGVLETALPPSIGNSVIRESKEKNYRDFRMFHFMYLWIVIWWDACLLCLYQPFIRLWQGEENLLPMHMVVLLWVYFFVFKAGDMSGIYKNAVGLWWQGKFVPLLSSCLNLTLNLILVRIIGLPGIVISTFVSIALVNIPYGGWVLFHYYFESGKRYARYLSDILIYFIETCFVSGVTWAVCSLLPEIGFAVLLLRACICAVLPNVLLLILNLKNPVFRQAVSLVMRVLPSKYIPGFIQKFCERICAPNKKEAE